MDEKKVKRVRQPKKNYVPIRSDLLDGLNSFESSFQSVQMLLPMEPKVYHFPVLDDAEASEEQDRVFVRLSTCYRAVQDLLAELPPDDEATVVTLAYEKLDEFHHWFTSLLASVDRIWDESKVDTLAVEGVLSFLQVFGGISMGGRRSNAAAQEEELFSWTEISQKRERLAELHSSLVQDLLPCSPTEQPAPILLNVRSSCWASAE